LHCTRREDSELFNLTIELAAGKLVCESGGKKSP
jgi:hypothetical protein